ncbi:hypothetical protein BSKO_06647 [Bryopsis sp. KO-2023]|nr:hypothetical protein BSKO_06647 [Bryopsis sp. KO-2023]
MAYRSQGILRRLTTAVSCLEREFSFGAFSPAFVRCRSAQPCPEIPLETSQGSSNESAAGKVSGKRWARELGAIRMDWTRDEISDILQTSLLDLVYNAASVHRMHHNPNMVQRCTLLNIKSGGCPEDCGYCSQSSKHSKTTGTKAERLLDLDSVYEAALRAKAQGSTRFCMGAAWRGPSQVGARQFDRVLNMVTKVRALGMEVCTTLGMLTPEQAKQLKEAGLTAYNHNLDTSPEFYSKITSTRKYEDRLKTVGAVREAGISVCCGGILGLGEKEDDRASLLQQLANMPEHPESVPINRLVAIKGTPMEDNKLVDAVEMIRCIAAARIVMPRSMVRLAAGRLNLSITDQAMCFMAGANSVFSGDELLTTKNNEVSDDEKMFRELGLTEKPYIEPVPTPKRQEAGAAM